jgi:hypothetical protein
MNIKNVHEIVCHLFLFFSSLICVSFSIDDTYNLLINRRISNSSTSTTTTASSSSNQEKSDSHSHYSSISSLNSRSSSINKNEQQQQPSITGQPLPPPPDLSSLGSKLTIATMTETFQLPKSLTLNKHQTKSRKKNSLNLKKENIYSYF